MGYYIPDTLEEKKFYNLFKFPLGDAHWSLTNLIINFHKGDDPKGLHTNSALTEKGELFIKWYLENYLSEVVEVIDIYLKISKCEKLFYAYKHIIFTPETIPEILSISNNPQIIAKLLL